MYEPPQGHVTIRLVGGHDDLSELCLEDALATARKTQAEAAGRAVAVGHGRLVNVAFLDRAPRDDPI